MRSSRVLRDFTQALLSAVILYSYLNAPVAAEGLLCPLGPFETDRGKIDSALANTPALSDAVGREHLSSTKPDAWTITDGVASEGGGGLAPPTLEGEPVSLSARVEYDAKSYVARYVRTEATLRGDRLVDERYFIRTIRPTAEQAKDIACLANQLLNPPVSPTKEKPAKKKAPRTDPAEIIVIASPRRPCSNEYTDGHWESLVLRVRGTQATASSELSCSDAGRLEALLSSAVGAPFVNTGVQHSEASAVGAP
jgi:hypothetical protein